MGFIIGCGLWFNHSFHSNKRTSILLIYKTTKDYVACVCPLIEMSPSIFLLNWEVTTLGCVCLEVK